MTTPLDEVASLLGDADPEVRRRGVQRIVDLDDAGAVTLLSRGLGDPDWRVRKEASAIAATVLPRAAVIECLFEAIHDRDSIGLRNAAVEALIALGRDVVPPTVRALGSADADARKLLVEVLAGVPDADGTRALVLALDDVDINVRATAAEALGTAAAAGEGARGLAVAALTKALAGSEPLVRLAALHALGRLEAEHAWEVFEPLTSDPLLRRYAIAAAARSREPAAIVALAEATGAGASAVAQEALVALVEALTAETEGNELRELARAKLVASPSARSRARSLAAGHDDPRVRGAALAALGLFRDSEDVPTLLHALSAGAVAPQAELGLVWFAAEAVYPLLEEARRSSPGALAAALSLLPSLLLAEVDAATFAFLREALTATFPDVLIGAMHALARVGEASDLARVVPFATHADPRVAATASAALSTLAARHPAAARALADTVTPDAPHAVVGCVLRGARAAEAEARARNDVDAGDLAFLRGALDHGDARVRRAAVEALASIGGPTAAVVVARALADEERDVVIAAVRALGRVGQEEPLLALLDGVRDPVVLAAALRALSEASPARTLEAARPFLRSEDGLLASSAIEAIGQLRDSRRDEALFVALEHPRADVVKSALAELSRDPSDAAITRVALCLDHPSFEVKRFAAEILGGQNDARAHTLARAHLARETDPVVRDALTTALTSVGRGARGEP